MVSSSSVSGSLVRRPGNSIALRKSDGNRYSSDLGNESGPGAEESRKQVWVDTAPRPTPSPKGVNSIPNSRLQMHRPNTQTGAHSEGTSVQLVGEQAYFNHKLFVYLRIQGNPLTSP